MDIVEGQMRDRIAFERQNSAVDQGVVGLAELFLNKYDAIYQYNVDARGYESITVDEWALEDTDFY